MNRGILQASILLLLFGFGASIALGGASASTTAAGASPEGAMNGGDRFSLSPGAYWQGRAGEKSWWWQTEFASPRRVGALEQVLGDHPFVLRNAPRHYAWQASLDGQHWFELFGAVTSPEERIYRVLRATRPRLARFVRLTVSDVVGDRPTLREVVFHEDPEDRVDFPEWMVVVNVTHDRRLPGEGEQFIPLARGVAPGFAAQQIWLTAFTPEFLSAEPKPLCAFLSGSFKDWCEVDRSHWRGVESALRDGRTPMWASCGGAQALGLISEYGVDHKWDCPHCPRTGARSTPLYGHIGHTAERPCGDYSGCVFERGPHWALQVGRDPVFAGLPAEFSVVESHCGQLEWTPAGWDLVATAGEGTRTLIQCVRKTGAPIYAAQFHIEMSGSPDVSRAIMRNFLSLARGYR